MFSDIEIEGPEAEKGSRKTVEGQAATVPKTKAKRRTKTGCMTCRKRRIKCGEEKPICRNCIRSKKFCTGYRISLVRRIHDTQATQHESTDSSMLIEQERYQSNTASDHPCDVGDQPQCMRFAALEHQVQHDTIGSGDQLWSQHFDFSVPDASSAQDNVYPVQTFMHPRGYTEHNSGNTYQRYDASHYFQPHRYNQRNRVPCSTPYNRKPAPFTDMLLPHPARVTHRVDTTHALHH